MNKYSISGDNKYKIQSLLSNFDNLPKLLVINNFDETDEFVPILNY